MDDGFFRLGFEILEGGAEEGSVGVEPSMCFDLFQCHSFFRFWFLSLVTGRFGGWHYLGFDAGDHGPWPRRIRGMLMASSRCICKEGLYYLLQDWPGHRQTGDNPPTSRTDKVNDTIQDGEHTRITPQLQTSTFLPAYRPSVTTSSGAA